MISYEHSTHKDSSVSSGTAPTCFSVRSHAVSFTYACIYTQIQHELLCFFCIQNQIVQENWWRDASLSCHCHYFAHFSNEKMLLSEGCLFVSIKQSHSRSLDNYLHHKWAYEQKTWRKYPDPDGLSSSAFWVTVNHAFQILSGITYSKCFSCTWFTKHLWNYDIMKTP